MNYKIKKIFKGLLVIIIAVQLLISAYYIGQWFWNMLNSYFTYMDFPKENRIFTTAYVEYLCSIAIRDKTPENTNIFWVPEVSVFVNYYIYPRKIYHVKSFKPGEPIEIEKDFLKKHNIDYVFFDYHKIYPIRYVQVINQGEKDIIVEK